MVERVTDPENELTKRKRLRAAYEQGIHDGTAVATAACVFLALGFVLIDYLS